MTSERAVEPRLYGDDLGEWEPSGTHADAYVDGWNAALTATPAPRENGLEELRREIETLPVSGERTPGPFISRAAVLAIVDRLVAARGEPPEPGPAIDVAINATDGLPEDAPDPSSWVKHSLYAQGWIDRGAALRMFVEDHRP